MVGTNVAHKGTDRLVAAFAQAWQQQRQAATAHNTTGGATREAAVAAAECCRKEGVTSGGTCGRLLLVCVGTGMFRLKVAVEQQWHNIWYAAGGDSDTGPAANAAAEMSNSHSQGRLLEAVHLFDATSDGEERLGWYAAADAQVVNSGECCSR